MVPKHWFQDCDSVSYNEAFVPTRKTKKSLDFCTTWKQIEAGLKLPQGGTHLAILYPTHSQFELFDVIALYIKNGQVEEKCGYQCKEGKGDLKRRPPQGFDRSFVLKGHPPEDDLSQDGWIVPSDNSVNDFFGVSGAGWTPKAWSHLENSLQQDNNNDVQARK